MSSPASRVKVKISNAEGHVTSLKDEIKKFYDSHPYEVSTGREEGTGKLFYYLKRVSEIPVTIPLRVGDALQNLRTSLDHLAYELVLIGNRGAVPGNHIYFPIADTAAKYADSKARRTQGMERAAITEIDAIAPYEGGNTHLWQLHKLNNIDKHRFLIPVWARYRSLDLGADIMQRFASAFPARAQELPDVSVFFNVAGPATPVKAGDILYTGAPGDQPNPKMKFAFEITLSEPEAGLDGTEPLVKTVQTLLDSVNATFARLERFLR